MRKILFFLFLLFVTFYLSLVSFAHAAAGINRTINFQGKVVNKTPGTNVTNGNYDFTFKLFNVASAGTALWTENWTGVNQITVTDGIFRANLGSITTFASANIDFNDDSLYLDITFNAEAFTTRVRFAAVPYAINAEKVSGLTVTNTTGTLTVANAKTFTVNNTLTLAGTDSTSFTFPTTSGGTVITSNAPSQGVTSAQTSGTVFGLTDSTALSAAIKGASITLSGTGVFDQTGLEFNLSGATGTNLNDIVGTATSWKVSKAGALTVASCTGCGGGGAITVRETDLAPSVASATVLEFGPTGDSTADFVVTDQTGGVARVVLGSNVAHVNAAETVTGGWTFTPGTTTDLIINGDQDSNIQFANTLTSDATSVNSFDFSTLINAAASTATVFGANFAQLDNTTNTGVVDAILRIQNDNAAETTADGLLIEQTGAGTLTSALEIKETAGTITDGILITGTLGNILNSASIDITGAGAITGITGYTQSAGSFSFSNGGSTFNLQGNSGTLTGVGGLTLSTSASGSVANISLTTNNNTAGPSGSISLEVGSSFAGTPNINIGTNTNAKNIFIGTGAVSTGVTIGNSTGGALTLGQNGGTVQIDGTNFDVSTAGTVTVAANQSYTGAGAVTLSSGGTSGLILDSASGAVTVAAGDALIITGGAGNPTATNGTVWYDTTANKIKIVEAGVVKTVCNLTDLGCGASGGGVNLSPATADSFGADNDPGIFLNENGASTTAPFLKFQSSGVDKVIFANNGGLSIFGATANVVKTTTGSTNSTDFSITGSTLTNVTSQNDTITLNEGTIPAAGAGTMATSAVVTAAAAGAGAQSIQREGGRYIIIHGNSLATGSSWDGSSTTMTSVTVATGATNPGAGAIALKRPDGRYLIVHGNASAGLTSLFDPRGITAVAAGPAVCGAAAATTGTNAFLRQDGKYVILCGGLTAWGTYDPTTTGTAYTAGTAVGTAFGAGAHAIQRDDGTFLVFRGGNTTSHWIYNPFASATGTMTADPIISAPPTITTGAFSIRRYDGKFLVMGGAINTSSVYDPTRTSANSGAGTMTAQSGVGFGPTAALADGAQAIRRQDGKYIMIVGAGSTVTNIIDPSVSTSSQFTAGPALPGAPGAGVHIVMRPNGQMQIIRGGATTTTDNYDTGYIIGGSGTGAELASYETECVTTTSLNTNSRLFWNANQEGQMTFQVKTGTGACSGSYKDILQSGDLIRPTAGDNRVQMKVFFKRNLPNFVDQGWGLWRGSGQVQYRRVALDPTLYDITVDNSNMVHRTQFEFGNSSDPSGPAAINMTNDRDKNLAIALAMGVGYGSTINATNPQFYNGAFGTHTALATSATAGTVVMRQPDGKFMVVAGNTTTANAQLYDPVAQTFTAQSGAGNIPTAGTGLGALALKRPDGKYLLLVGNATTTTNIYDPLGASGSQFVVGPVLTAAAGRGALAIPLPNGRVLIMHGNFTNTSSIYDPIQNTMVAGPTPSVVVGGGSMTIPRPDGTFLFVPGIATEACTALNTTTNNFDPYSMQFTATGSPAITTGVGPGAFAFQRSDGQWVIVHGGGTASTCAGTTRTQIYNPITNKSVVGPIVEGGATDIVQHGGHAISRPDGTWLIVQGGGATNTSIYLEKAGAFTTEGLGNIGQFIAGPALVTAASAGSISFQRDDGKFVTITGNAGTVMQEYDGGWVASGIYKSEQLNVADLDSNSTLTWRASPTMKGISAEVRTATSQLGLQTATAREIPISGGLINPGGSETWLQINFNFKRTFPSYGGIYTDTWYNGGSTNNFRLRQIDTPTLTEFKVNKDVNLVDLKSDGLSMFRVSSSGDIFSSATGSINTGGADLAENYTSAVPLEKGEVVSIDPQNNHGVKLSQYQYQPDVLGVVSTAPGFVAGSYTKDSYPIALIGRVPVKVSTENGMIKVGDYLTSSSLPGHAMKAALAGRVLGKALENLDENKLTDCPSDGYPNPNRKCAEIMMFVNLVNYLGSPVRVVMAEQSNKIEDIGLSSGKSSLSDISDFIILSNDSTETSEYSEQGKILAFLRKLKEEQENYQYNSEIFADRIAAKSEVISPKIFTDLLFAKKIKADSIEGLEILTSKIASLDQKLASQSATASGSAVLSADQISIPTSIGDITIEKGTVTLDLSVLGWLKTKGGLVAEGNSEFRGETIFNSLANFLGNVVFQGKVSFASVPKFSKNTAGFARIKKGQKYVYVRFEKEYESQPIISVSITLEKLLQNDPSCDASLNIEQCQEKVEKEIISQNIKFLITNKSEKGFKVLLEKEAPLDLKFSWIAIAVTDAQTFENEQALDLNSPSPTPVEQATPTPAESTPIPVATESAQNN